MAVHFEARLKQSALKTAILFSHSTKALLGETFQVIDSVEVKAKGIDRPIIGHILKNEITKKEIVTVQKNGISLKFDPNIVDTKEVDKFLSKIEK